MCTAVTYKTRDFYMGRTLDYEFSYGEQITVMPRRYPLKFCHGGESREHYAVIGMAHVADGYPLYYDAVNEKGLGMAGLNFVGNAVYRAPEPGRLNVAQYEFIPFVLSRCATVAEVRELLGTLNLTGAPFGGRYPAAELHWLIADASGAIVVESAREGLHVYDNPVGVLANNPPFDWHMTNLSNFMSLSTRQPVSSFAPDAPLSAYSRGMGALGLPGDVSSASRFVRAAFVRANSRSDDTEEASVSQLFHIFGTVEQVRGVCEVAPGKYEITIYTGLWNASRGIYYYTTYEDSRRRAVDMHADDLDGVSLCLHPLVINPAPSYVAAASAAATRD